MYIAFKRINNTSRYFLRESCMLNGELTHRHLLDLGEDPSNFIVYPGGNSFYIDESVQDMLDEQGIDAYQDELEDLFWPWIRPDIQRALETFQNRSQSGKKIRLTDREKARISRSVHELDKRRVHFLKFGNMDQGPLENMPEVLFRHLLDKSRDEIEQLFLVQEAILPENELKSYVYTVFNLQGFFQGMMAKKMPHVLDQGKVDNFFIQEICRVNQELFGSPQILDEYLLRYVFMFFDHDYGDTTLLKELYNDFIFRHHFHDPPKPEGPRVSRTRAMKIFNIKKEEIKTMDKASLIRRYRKLARQHHPDKGGSEDGFIEITAAYHSLLKKIRS
ncbi:MAG: J domain-containing protein [Desulfobacteraceae bacterium]